MSTLINFLKAEGLSLADDERSVLSHSDRPTQIVPLVHQRVLAIKGPDTEKFLQGQLTCDMRTVLSRGSALGAHCNIKGHMLSLFRAIRISQEEVWLRMHHEIFDDAQANLKKYIIFSKAEANEISATVAGLGIAGPGAQALIERLFEQVPTEDNGVLSVSKGAVIRVPGDRFEIWMPQEALLELLKNLPIEVAFGATDHWILSEIDAAVPDVRTATQEAFIPQMVNLQALEGVSFNKGCYTGQEIVTRLQHRGVLKKPMYIAEVETTIQPLAGDKICDASGNSVGDVVISAPSDPDQPNCYRLLAVINKKAADEEVLQLSQENSPLSLKALPYTLDPNLFTRKGNTV
jgi:folate-binding protein YgfZ